MNAGKAGITVNGGYVDSMKDGQALCGLLRNFDEGAFDKAAVASASELEAIEMVKPAIPLVSLPPIPLPSSASLPVSSHFHLSFILLGAIHLTPPFVSACRRPLPPTIYHISYTIYHFQAFSAAEGYGAPRLLDAQDLASGKIDARSLSTYLVMLQSALMEHDKVRNQVLIKESDDLEAKANAEAAWGTEQANRIRGMTAAAVKLDPGKKEAVTDAEKTWDDLDAFQAGEMKVHKDTREQLTQQRERLVKKIRQQEDADNFVHGPRRRARLTKRADSDDADRPPRSADEVQTVLDGIEPSWVDLAKAEEECREALDSILTTRRTDAMLVEVETKASDLARAASDWAQTLINEKPDAMTISLVGTQAASDLLERWAAEVVAANETREALKTKLEDVSRRRKKEEREEPPAWDSFEAGIITADVEAAAAASAFRRALAAGVAKQVEKLEKLTSSWSRVANTLETQLENDPQLVSPVPSLPWFAKCFGPK